MRIFTAHTRPAAAPLLLRDGFSWGACIFGPFWLAAHRAWIAAVLVLCADLLNAALVPGLARPLIALGIAWLLGLFGQDIRRWTLERRGYALAHVIAAPDRDTALARLFDRRPDLVPAALA